MMNKEMILIGRTALIIGTLLLGACERTELDAVPTASDEEPELFAKARCPQITKHYEDLAIIAGPPTPATGHLNTVYQRCFPVPACGSFTNPTGEILGGCAQFGSVEVPVASLPYITYPEQVAMITYLRSMAQANAPICSGNVKKVVKSMKFYRDPYIYNSICAYVVYACCGSGQN